VASPDPVLHLGAGPNGTGKTTLATRVIVPATGLPFVDADVIAAQHWPTAQAEHAHQASQVASEQRGELIAIRRSFITETFFSHPSTLALIREAHAAGYHVTLHVVLVPDDLTVARGVRRGGHAVPEDTIRERYHRLWTS
jgi:predicted ABC-type ATPase